jgi:serpin B
MSSANQQKFADALTSSLYSEPNECSSALSVSMVFSLLYPGATNDGIIDMRDTFGYPDSSNMQLVWDDAAERMTERANGACISWSWNGDGTCVERRSQLKFANSVWLDKSDELNDAYVHVVGDYAMQANFNSPSSATAVNSWVKNATNGLIDGIVPEGEPLYPTKLLAVNSIYLESRWGGIEPFDSMNTNLDSFYASPSRSTKVSMAHFMNTVKEFDYSHEALAGYQTIKLPLQDNMSMIFVLPQTDGAKAVKSTALIAALDGLEYTKVALALPKFNFQSKYENDLKDSLIELGLDSLFSPGTDSLCGLLEDSACLSIDKVIQKTSIAVTEEGVLAAATTAVGMVGMAMPSREEPILMMLDHPFQFFIFDEEEKLMLFEGRLGAPKVPEEEPSTPLLDAKHSDANFWKSHFGWEPVDAPVPTSSTPLLQSW